MQNRWKFPDNPPTSNYELVSFSNSHKRHINIYVTTRWYPFWPKAINKILLQTMKRLSSTKNKLSAFLELLGKWTKRPKWAHCAVSGNSHRTNICSTASDTPSQKQATVGLGRRFDRFQRKEKTSTEPSQECGEGKEKVTSYLKFEHTRAVQILLSIDLEWNDLDRWNFFCTFR